MFCFLKSIITILLFSYMSVLFSEGPQFANSISQWTITKFRILSSNFVWWSTVQLTKCKFSYCYHKCCWWLEELPKQLKYDYAWMFEPILIGFWVHFKYNSSHQKFSHLCWWGPMPECFKHRGHRTWMF